MRNIFRVGDNGLVDEFYFIGKTKDINYAIFANTSGHLPIRVYLTPFTFQVADGHGWFTIREDATNHGINSARHLIKLLKEKF